MIELHERKISVQGLAVGLFVSRLDRPWAGTPFVLEGLLLRNDEEVRTLQRMCRWVYVDTIRGKQPDQRWEIHDVSDIGDNARGKAEVASLRKKTWETSSTLVDELKTAVVVHEKVDNGIREMMADLEEGRNLDLHVLKEGVEAMVDSIVRNPSAFTWLREMKHRDAYSYKHALGCAIWAGSLGRYLGLEKPELQKLSLAGLLADVGKIRLPVELLTKSHPFDADDLALVRKHVDYSLEILRNADGATPQIIEMVATHHERHDGSGYPYGLSGSRIPMYGRILGLVDSYDAMISTRPYAQVLSPNQAVESLYEQRGILFQPALVEQFIQSTGIYPIGSLVELTDGRVAVITEVHEFKRLRPSVMVLLGKDKKAAGTFKKIDLSLIDEDDQGMPLGVRAGVPAGAYGINTQDLFLD